MDRKFLVAFVTSVGLTMLFSCVQPMQDNPFPTPKQEKSTGKWGYVDKTKQVVIPYQYDEAATFKDGVASVTLNGKEIHINKVGQEFERIYSLYGDLRKVVSGGKYGYLNSLGETLISCIYDKIGDFYDDTGNEVNKDFVEAIINERKYFIDQQGKEAHLSELQVAKLQVYGKTRIIKHYAISKDEKGKTKITITGNGFDVLTFINGKATVPVYCDFVSEGKVYKADSWSFRPNYVDFVFSSSMEPEKIVFYPSDEIDNASKRIEINARRSVLPDE